MLAFFTVLFTLLGIIWGYTGYSYLELPEWAPQVRIIGWVFVLCTLLAQILRWVVFGRSSNGDKFSWFAYFTMGLMVHLFLGAVVKDLISVLLFSWDQTFLAINTYHFYSAIITFAICLAANLWGTLTALAGPRVQSVNISVESQHRQGRPMPFKIAQISDLHVGPIIKRSYVEKVVKTVNSLDADLVVITGDLGDGLVDQLHHDLEPLRSLKAQKGVFYVPGNHEYYWNVQEWLSKVKDLGMIPLLNSGREIPHPHFRVWLGGIPDSSAHRFVQEHKANAPLAMPPKESSQSYFKILLAHQPKSYKEAQLAGFDLMLNGHTHNGQFFPFNFLVGFFNPFSKGHHREGSLQIYVNSGTGFWGPPLRLGIPSEITLIELQ